MAARLVLVAVVLALVAPTSASSAATLPADTTAVISGTPDLTALLPTPLAESHSSAQSVDHDGGRVAFTSESDALLAGDDDDVSNVYVKDVASGAVTLASIATNGQPSHSFCDDAVISDDGTHVAFVCRGPLDPADTNDDEDVYERDLTTNQTVLVSRAGGLGAVGNDESTNPSIDATGAHVAFETDATNLGDGAPATSLSRVYRRTISTADNSTVLISRATGAAGAAADSDAQDPSIDNSGTRVAFDTPAALDAAADTNGRSDVYLRTLGPAASTTELVSRASAAAGAVGDGDSQQPAISGNGSFVAFQSTAGNLVPGQPANGPAEIFRRSMSAAATQLMSAKADGTPAAGARSDSPTIDDTGAVVAFTSAATNLGGSPGRTSELVYVRNTSSLTLASPPVALAPGVASDVESAPALSGDGTQVAFSTSDVIGAGGSNVRLRDLAAAVTRTVSSPAGVALANVGGDADGGSMSADGRFVVFAGAFGAFGAPLGNVFVRDTATGGLTTIPVPPGPGGAPQLVDGAPVISADGRRVALVVSPDDQGDPEIYVYDIPSGQTFLISRADGPNGAPANGNDIAGPVTLSDDGSRVAFISDATNLSPDDPSDDDDVYVRDVNASRTFLVSRPTGVLTGPGKADESSFEAAISGDGRRVAFSTDARNLGDGDTNSTEDVHLRAIDTGVTQLVSIASDGTQGNNISFDPSISRDGNRISFVSAATNFVAATPARRLYVRDMAARTLIVAGRADGAAGGLVTVPNGRTLPMISADGATVAFAAHEQFPVAPGDPADGTEELFARNLTTGVTRLVSRATGPGGAAAPGSASPSIEGMSADGGCVGFDAGGRVLGPPPISNDFEAVFVRVFEPDCGRPPVAVSAPGGPVPGSGSGAGPVRDRTAPRLTHVRLSHARFRVRAKATTLSLTVSEAATLTVTVDRERPGRRAGTKKHPTCKVVAKAPKKGACVGLSRDGVLRHVVKRAGAVKIVFSGKIGHKRLAVGRHRMIVVARDRAGNASKPVTVRFTVIR